MTTLDLKPPLSERVVRLLLQGPGIAGAWRPRDVPEDVWPVLAIAEAGRLWSEHKDFLRAEAERRGLRPTFPGRRYYGEAALAVMEERR